MLNSGILEWINQYLGAVSPGLLYQYFFAESPLNENDAQGFSIRNPDKGIVLELSRLKVIESIYLCGEANETQKQFKEKIPLELQFSFSRQQVIELFGKPKRKGGGHTNVLHGFVNPWDKYFFEAYTLRFDYSANENNIVMLTIGALSNEKDVEITLNRF